MRLQPLFLHASAYSVAAASAAAAAVVVVWLFVCLYPCRHCCLYRAMSIQYKSGCTHPVRLYNMECIKNLEAGRQTMSRHLSYLSLHCSGQLDGLPGASIAVLPLEQQRALVMCPSIRMHSLSSTLASRWGHE